MTRRVSNLFIGFFTLFALGIFTMPGCGDQNFVVSADRPLRVTSLSPQDGTKNVQLNTEIRAVFSESVVKQSVTNGNNFYVENVSDSENPVKIEGEYEYDDAALTVTFKPETELSYSSEYRISLTEGIEKADTDDSFGGELAKPVSAKFRTVDPDHLKVVYSNPAGSAYSVPVFSEVKVIFSHPVNRETVKEGETFKVEDITDPDDIKAVKAAEEGIQWNEEGRILTYTPSEPYGYSRTLRVTLSSEIATDEATENGGHLMKDVVIPFKTVDPPPVQLVSASPSDGASNIDRETEVNSGDATAFVLTFSEGIAQSEVDTNRDGVLDSEDNGAVMVHDITDGEEAVFVPCDISWTDSEGNEAKDAGKTDDYDNYLVGSDVKLTLTPKDIPGYSRLLRITLAGDSDPAEHPTSGVIMSDRATKKGGQLPATQTITFRMEDPPALGVENAVSGSGNEPMLHSVEGEPDTLKIVFTEGVNQSSAVLGSTVLVEDVTGLEDPLTAVANGSISGSLSWNAEDDPGNTSLIGSDTTVTFIPDTLLQYGTKIRVTLTGEAAPSLEGLHSDRATIRGGQLPETKTFLFDVETIPDLTVTEMTPGNGSDQIPIDQSLTVKFSEGIDCSTLSLEESGGSIQLTFDSSDPENPDTTIDASISPECSDNDTSITLVPATPIKYSRDVKLTLTNDIASVRARDKNPAYDPLQGHLRDGYVGRYSTIDPPALGVENAVSGSGNEPMLHSVEGEPDTLKIVFTEGVNQSSAVLGSTVLVEDVTGLEDPLTAVANGSISGSLSWNAEDDPGNTSLIGSDTTVTFIPDTLLQYGTKIRVTLTGEAAPSLEGLHSDRATIRGGQLPETKTFLFDVETIPDLTVTEMTPGNGSDQIPIDQSLTVKFSEGIDCSTLSLEESGGSIQLTFDSSDPENPDTTIDASISPECSDNDTSITLVPATPIKYSRDVKLTLTNDIASVRARDKNPAYDPLQGHLRDGYVGRYSTIDPPTLGVTGVGTQSGSFLMERNDAIFVNFSEGVDQETAELGVTVFVEDVTGTADPMYDDGTEIPGALSWNAADEPSGSDLIGDDDTMTYQPETLFQYGTLVRVTVIASEDPLGNVFKSDRATARGGQMINEERFLVEVKRLPELYVVSTDPGHNSRTVASTESTIDVTFSEAPDCDTIIPENISVTYDQGTFADDPVDTVGAAVDGSWECTAGNNTITFTATEEFGHGRDILVHLSSDIADRNADGNINSADPTQGHLVPDYTFGFGTAHMTYVQILSTNVGGSSSFKQDADISVVFDRDIDCGRISDQTVYVVRQDSPSDKLTATLSCSGSEAASITLDPQDDTASSLCDGTSLCFDTEYTLILEGGSEGVCVSEKLDGDSSDDGCIKSPDAQFDFKTQKAPELSVNISPAHDSTAVSISETPTCTFSTPLNTETVENEPDPDPSYPDPDGVTPNICLIEGKNKTDCDGADVVSVSYVYTEGDTVVTIKPDTALDTETWYTVVVSRDVEDVNGQRLGGFNTSSFKTSPGGLINRVFLENEESLDTMEVHVEFIEDIDTETVHSGTFYLTYTNEFGGTTFVPATISIDNWDGSGSCDPLSSNEHCDLTVLSPDFSALYACGSEVGDPQYELPLNTEFQLHVSSWVKNANWDIDPEHVPTSVGENEFLWNFNSPASTEITSVKYSNLLTGPTNLPGADEVPVNSEIEIRFAKDIDPATVTGETVIIEDSRGGEGVVTSGASTFTAGRPGTFNTEDTGKEIEILNSVNQSGVYEITGVIDDTTVTLDVTFSDNEAGLYWRRRRAPSSLVIDTPSADTVTISADELFNHHVDHRGSNASVSAGSNTVTLSSTHTNYEFSAERDVGSRIYLVGGATPMEAMIIGVNDAKNAVVDRTFSFSASELDWRIHDDRDYHTLRIVGRSRRSTSHISDVDGNPLAGTAAYSFTTSPETMITFTPNGQVNPGVGMDAAAIFSRPLSFESVNENALYFTQNGVKSSTLLSFSAELDNTVVLSAVPAYEKSRDIYVVTTDDIMDWRGNPVPADSIYLGVSQNTPASDAIKPDSGADVSPSGGTILGDQTFTLTWGTDSRKQTMKPALVNSQTVDFVQIYDSNTDGAVNDTDEFSSAAASFTSDDTGRYIEISGASNEENNGRFRIAAVIDSETVTLEEAQFTAENTLDWELLVDFDLNVDFYPDHPSTRDRAQVSPSSSWDATDSGYFKAGYPVELRMKDSEIPNMYNFAAPSDNVYTFTVDSTALTVTEVLGESESGGMTSADGVTDISADSIFLVVFDKSVHPKTVSGSNITLTDNGGNSVSCTYETVKNIVAVTPDTDLQVADSSYTLTVSTDVTDTAGNNLGAGHSVSFFIEDTEPSVVATFPADGDSSVSVGESISVWFDEKMASSAVAGNVSLSFVAPAACDTDVDEAVEICRALDESGMKLDMIPYADLMDETAFTSVISSGMTDLAGNTLLGGDYEWFFETSGGDNGPARAVCSDLPLAEGEQTVDVYFSEILDAGTVLLKNVIVYNVDSGETVPGTVTTADGDTVVRFTADAPFTAGEDFGIIITVDIIGDDGEPIWQEYRTFFTGAGS